MTRTTRSKAPSRPHTLGGHPTYRRTLPAAELYRQLDAEFDTRLGTSMGFEALLGTSAYEMDDASVAGFRDRYRTIKTFQDEALVLFKASLQGECHPDIAAMVVGDLPAAFGADYHRALTEAQHRTPVFFRTDEVAPGKLSEIQCCGSAWDLVELIQSVYAWNPQLFGEPCHFEASLAATFSRTLRRYLGTEPVVHYLVDNASRPHGARYFLQRTRDEGIRYFGYDRDVHPNDCNFVRSHDFVSLLHHNFFADRMGRCNESEVRFDLPPSALFDAKLIMAWPFWSKTREHFSDEVRELFPYTTMIGPDEVDLAGGETLGVDEFCDLPPSERPYYIKYAGTDVAINWGSRAVFLASTLSRPQIRELTDTIVRDWRRGRHWILQSSVRSKENVAAYTRDGAMREMSAYAKWSGFYGPDGCMAILAMHKNFTKVHGSADTVLSVVY